MAFGHSPDRPSAVRTVAGIICAERGMTILETLIAVFIGVIVAAAAMQSYLTMHSQSIVQDEVTDMQQSGRAAMRILSQQLRMAGFGLPATLAPVAGVDANPDAITVTYLDENGCEVTTTADMASVTDDLECDGAALSCLAPGMRAYVYDGAAGVGEFFGVAAIHSAPDAIAPNAALSRTYPLGSRVSLIHQFSYFLDLTDTLHPTMMQQPSGSPPQPYAEDIEDLQFAYLLENGDTVATPANPTLVQSVLVRLVARTPRMEHEMENDYHRRTYAFEVSLRNLE